MTRGRHPQDQRQTPSYPGARHPSPSEQTHSPEQTTSPGTRGRHPQDERQTPPRADTFPRTNTPLPWEQTSPWEQTPLPSACWEIRATSRQYASYWNVYLLCSKIRDANIANFVLFVKTPKVNSPKIPFYLCLHKQYISHHTVQFETHI